MSENIMDHVENLTDFLIAFAAENPTIHKELLRDNYREYLSAESDSAVDAFVLQGLEDWADENIAYAEAEAQEWFEEYAEEDIETDDYGYED